MLALSVFTVTVILASSIAAPPWSLTKPKKGGPPFLASSSSLPKLPPPAHARDASVSAQASIVAWRRAMGILGVSSPGIFQHRHEAEILVILHVAMEQRIARV